MIDLVQAGPFTFCPSLFVAAYVEADQTKTTAGTAVGTTGAVGNIDSPFTYHYGTGFEVTTLSSPTAVSLPNNSNTTSTETIAGSGVVLVLATGSHKAKCANPEAVVQTIFTKVAEYFNAITPA